MKVGIFGDSYASLPTVRFISNPTLSWIEVLMQQYDVSCFGRPGSSLFYSVDRFKTFHSNFDKIVFVATHPGRIDFNWYTYRFCKTDLDRRSLIMGMNFSSIEHGLDMCKDTDNISTEIVKALNAAKDYFLYIDDYRISLYTQELMIRDIKSIRPDIIVVPAFELSLPPGEVVSMHHVQTLEEQHWGKIPSNTDFRYCHMTGENNKIFAEHVERWLNGEPVVIDLNNFDHHPATPMECYFPT